MWIFNLHKIIYVNLISPLFTTEAHSPLDCEMCLTVAHRGAGSWLLHIHSVEMFLLLTGKGPPSFVRGHIQSRKSFTYNLLASWNCARPGEMAQSVKYLTCKHENLIPSTHIEKRIGLWQSNSVIPVWGRWRWMDPGTLLASQSSQISKLYQTMADGLKKMDINWRTEEDPHIDPCPAHTGAHTSMHLETYTLHKQRNRAKGKLIIDKASGPDLQSDSSPVEILLNIIFA